MADVLDRAGALFTARVAKALDAGELSDADLDALADGREGEALDEWARSAYERAFDLAERIGQRR